MNVVSKIVCKTVGVAGISAVVYDAYSRAKVESKRTSQKMVADSFERIHAAKRTTTKESYVDSAIQSKVADMRMDNPIIPFAGRIGGFVKGGLNSLGDNIVPVTFSALALGTKGFFSKLGAMGVGGVALYTILKESFGVGKTTPMD